jgi:hypothetical protein
MKKIILIFTLALVAFAAYSTPTASLTMKTTMSLNVATDYTLTSTTADTILIYAPKNYWTTQSYAIELDSTSGNHTSVATSLYGRISTSDSWTQIGSTITWVGSDADTSFSITSTAPNNYKYFMIRIVGVGTGVTTISNQIFNQWYIPANSVNYAFGSQSAGTANAITLNYSPDLPALYEGMIVSFIADSANTGATTLAIDGGTAKSIYEQEGATPNALDANDIRAGTVQLLQYDGTQWIKLSPSGN